MKKRFLAIAAVAAVGLTTVAGSAAVADVVPPPPPTSAPLVNPVVIGEGNQDCDSVAASLPGGRTVLYETMRVDTPDQELANDFDVQWYEFAPLHGDLGLVLPGYIVEVITDETGTIVSFTSIAPTGFAPILVNAAIVKGGPNANVYIYEPGVVSDSGLVSPDVGPDKPAALSNITFCGWELLEDEPDPENLVVTKTAVTSYDRAHHWSVDKSVDPEAIFLYAPGGAGLGTASAEWTVDVTYEGYTDSNFLIEGEIEIENTGGTAAVITDVTDTLTLGESDYDAIVDCGGEDTVEPGETITCSYSYVPASTFVLADGTNVAEVTTVYSAAEGEGPYSGNADVTWGDPVNEADASVTVDDSLEGPQGTVTQPDNGQFKYSETFNWADEAECGTRDIDNTASIYGDSDVLLGSADAKLTINVQCLVFGNGETAWAANGDTAGQLRYNNRRGGNWATYVQYFAEDKTTTMFAGQTIDVGDVNFSAPVDGVVTITVELAGWIFDVENLESLKVQDYASAPSGNPNPGGFAHKTSCEETTCTINVPSNNFYGVHADVGQWVPDPDFGPMINGVI